MSEELVPMEATEAGKAGSNGKRPFRASHEGATQAGE